MKRLLIALFVMLLLGGCSTVRLIDTQVLAISTLPPNAPPMTGVRYRFDRLPSQTQQIGGEHLEALAQEALTRVGLILDEAKAQYSVSLTVNVQPYRADAWGNPLYQPWPGYGHFVLGGGTGGASMGLGMGMHFPPSTSYRRELSLVLRDLRNSQVAYETRVMHEGPWSDTSNILPAMFQAALTDFPNPPAGPRRVNIEIPR